MAGIFNGPARGGTRGGRSEFSWDNVKSDASREYYLGHSVKATTGRWAKNKDVYWYTRDKEEGESADIRRENELAMVKQREQDLMMEALGVKPKAPKHETRQPRLDQEDMKKLLGKNEDDDYQNQASPGGEGDRIRGLGYNASRTTGAIQSGVDQERLDGMGMQRSTMPPSTTNRDAAAAVLGAAAALPSSAAHGGESLKKHHRSREEKKSAKRVKKESRKEKKRSSRKDSKRRRDRSRSRSRSRSPPRRDLSASPRRKRKEYSSDSSDSRDRKYRRRRRSRSRSPVEEPRERQRRQRESRSRSRERRR
jgi:hypothetical protein